MIQRETKYIIRRILIGVGIALILGFINACQVKAETQILSPNNLTPVGYYGNNVFYPGTKNCNNNVCFWNTQSGVTSLRWNAQSTLTYSDIQIVVFNMELYSSSNSQEWPINDVSFGDYSCYYIRNNEQSTSTTSPYVSLGISALCPIKGTINLSSGSKTANVTFDNSGGFVLNKISLSNITFSKDSNLLSVVTTLGSISNAINPLHQDLTYLLQSANNSAYWNEVNSGKLQNIYDILNSQTNTITSAITNQTTSITNAQNNTTTAVNDMNDTLKDSNVDSPNSSISQMEQNLPTNSVISDLLTLPIRMFQNIVNAIDGTCSPFSLGALFGTNLVLPCINIQNYLGSALWSAIDVIFCGIFVLSMRKKFVEIFENITSLKNGGNELE